MTGTKLLIGSTLIFIGGLLVGGYYFPDSLVLSMANTSAGYTFIRIVIALLLISLLVTKPPRALWLRVVIGSWSIMLAVVSVQSLLNYQLRLLDALVFLEVAIIFAVEALETRVSIPVDKKPSARQRIPVVSH